MSKQFEALEVYSGEVRLCAAGRKTDLRDMNGKALFTGDIVVTFIEKEGEVTDVCALSVVVIAEDSRCFGEDAPGKPFVMGIRGIDLVNEPGYWRVWKIKDFSDVIIGEHWKAYGFSYQLAARALDTAPQAEGVERG